MGANMRIAIINMPCRLHAAPNIVPVGIYHVGAAIKRARPADEIVYLDLNLIRPSTKHTLAVSLKPVLDCDVFLLSGLITTLDYQRDVAEIIREEKPMAFIVCGGGLATNCPSETLDWVSADVAYVGEAESGIGEMLDRYESESEWLIEVWHGQPVDRLDDFTIDWDDAVGLAQYIPAPIWGRAANNSSATPFDMKRSLNMITSRGCPMSCKFCSRDATGGRNYRMRSAESVVAETKMLVDKYDLDFIGYVDDNMLVNSTRNQAIAAGLREIEGFRWGCHARFDLPMGDLLALAASGCQYIGFGGESANRDILKAMDKHNDPERMIEVLNRCRDLGIHPNVTWMMGWPGETIEQVRDTVRFILEHAPENKRLFVATAYPGTDLWREVQHQILGTYRLLDYVRALDDATEPLMNYTAMDDVVFHDLAKKAAAGRLEEML